MTLKKFIAKTSIYPYNKERFMRDNFWLLKTTRRLWRQYFSDLPVKNDILVLFGRCNKRVLGSIKYNREKQTTFIRLNGHFKNEKIPSYVVAATLVHELVHYLHGFSSPQQKLYRYPHRGGVITKELRKRNLDRLEKKAKKWLHAHWSEFLKK